MESGDYEGRIIDPQVADHITIQPFVFARLSIPQG
jgi:hypothetical protein